MGSGQFVASARGPLTAIVALALIGTLLSACASGNSPSSGGVGNISGTIKVGAPQSLTGPAAFAGTQIKEGQQLALEEINSSRFLGSATLSVNFVDVGTTPQQGVTVVRQMIEQDQISAIVGWTSSAQTPAVAPVAQAAKVPMIVTEGGSPGVSATGDYITQVNLQQFKYADKMGRALKSLGVTTTAVLYDQGTPTISTLVHTYTDYVFPKYGIKATLKAYLIADTDLSAGVTQGLAANVDAIGCLFVGAQGTTCLSQSRSAGFKGRLWGQSGFAGGTALKAGSIAEGLLYTTGFSPDFIYPESKKFVELYKAKHSGNVPASFQAEGYDGIWLLARAVKEGNGTSREAIHAGLLTILARGQVGAHGPMTWDKDRMLEAQGAIIQIKGGTETLFL